MEDTISKSVAEKSRERSSVAKDELRQKKREEQEAENHLKREKKRAAIEYAPNSELLKLCRRAIERAESEGECVAYVDIGLTKEDALIDFIFKMSLAEAVVKILIAPGEGYGSELVEKTLFSFNDDGSDTSVDCRKYIKISWR